MTQTDQLKLTSSIELSPGAAVGIVIKRLASARPLVFAMLVFGAIAATGQSAIAQSLSEVTNEECVTGDCINGRGKMELTTPYGKGHYIGNFRDGEFQGQGRLEVPISFLERAIYKGNWEQGIRSGRGTYWNGKGKLYIGQWVNNKRHGHGSYFFNLAEWHENEHSEYWMAENTENYTGEFVNDFYQGQGTYRWPGGQKYSGGFFANSKHGPGTYFYVTGTRREQLWNYGDFIR